MSHRGIRRLLVGGAACVAAAAALAACGGSGSGTNASNDQKAVAFSGGNAVPVPTFASQVALPKKSVGILSVSQSDPGAALLASSAQDAMKTLGWSSFVVDGGGDPSKMAAGMTQIVNRNVDAVLLDAVDPAVVTAGLQAAKARNVPVILYGGTGSPSPLVAASVVPNDFTLSALATDYLVNTLGGKGKVAIMTTDGIPFAGNRTAQLKFELQKYPGIKVVATHQVDFAKFDTDLQTATKSVLQANPDLNAIFATISPFPSPIAAALRQAGKTKDVSVIGFYAYPSELDLIQKGQLAAVADTSFPQNAYQSVDLLAQYFGKHTPITSSEAFKLPLQYQLVTKDNAPPAGQSVKTSVNFVGYYDKLWNNEFTLAEAK